MMRKIKLVALDLDGTLVNTEKKGSGRKLPGLKTVRKSRNTDCTCYRESSGRYPAYDPRTSRGKLCDHYKRSSDRRSEKQQDH